ncbi:MAG: DNA polymerase-3 subunit alpha [Luteibaculaceae bacterium]|jgi:DNA polymerase-3 subunit alpha
MYIVFDTETTGLPKNYNAPISDSDNWPRLVQLAWQLHEPNGKLVGRGNEIIKPVGYEIPFAVSKIHGITTERANAEGKELGEVLSTFLVELEKARYSVGHNIEFDINIVGAELFRMGLDTSITEKESIDTKNESVQFCAIPMGSSGRFKWPTLTELHTKLFGVPFGDAHDAAYDVDATAKCFFGLLQNNIIVPEDSIPGNAVRYEAPVLEKANFEDPGLQVSSTKISRKQIDAAKAVMQGKIFTHLHNHSQFSILQSTSQIPGLVQKAVEMGMPGIAITDHGNMMSAFHFVRDALKAGIKPILGCELNLCTNHEEKSFKDNGYQLVLLAKNKKGYHNICKMSSTGFINGFYYVPRIDRTILEQYKEDIIVLTGGLWGEVPHKLLNNGESEAEEAFLYYKEHFGDNFYAEINRHGVEEEVVVNEFLLKMCTKHAVKYIATNNTYYINKEDANAHDILLCVKEGEKQSKPKRYIGKLGREFRYGFPNDEFYIKSQDEMIALFADIPEALYTTQEIVDKIESFELAREVLLPAFDIPEEFQDSLDSEDGGKRGENNYLRHLTYVGAKKRYPEITPEITERLDFELETIAKTGYPGYFLIVQDFTTKAREMGVSVGPGRGSAAGSAVAYCVAITNVDPIKYDLLFERFLNPERVSMPDIDIDFDDEGRQRVIDYVINKYGSNQVAQIITYGTMAAKSSIRDTGRVLELPLSETDQIAKLIPDLKLKKLFNFSDAELKDKLKGNGDDMDRAHQLKKMASGNDLVAQTINQAVILEGSLRNTGIHACGIIITPDDITKYVPVATAKDSDMVCTQFDNSVVEDAGLLKMDFLGLKTLTLIKDTCRLVKEGHAVIIDPDEIPLDDVLTYELFQRGETIGIFQYESPGMQKHMKNLKPTVFADLIAMNALYRPGPIEYIPSFIDRKHGKEEIIYDLDACQEFLEETYGITVYQEQVMLLSQKLAGFSKGQADSLRKAMGKKKKDLIDELKPLFLNGGEELGHDKKKLEKIWKDWEAFASYAFNKSHSTCYAWIAYQTAYLKAHYPAEYMAAVLSNNMNDIKQVSFFMEECKRMQVPVLGPSVNESGYKFAVNAKGEIRFGLGAVKGVGEGAVLSIIESRKGSPYRTIFDFTKKVDLRSVNKKAMENLVLGGAFDEFPNLHRGLFFTEIDGQRTFLEMAVRFGAAMQEAKNAPPDLFGNTAEESIPEPPIPAVPTWDRLTQLSKEKAVVGMYISGHPLDDYKFEIEQFCNINISQVKHELPKYKGRDVKFAGIITAVQERIDKRGNPFGIFTMEDYHESKEFLVFRDDWAKIRSMLSAGAFIYVKGKVQAHPYRPEDLELKFNSVNWLSDVAEEQAKSITFSVPTWDISPSFTEDMERIMAQFPGKGQLKFHLYQKDQPFQRPLASRRKISITNDLIQEMEKLGDLKWKIN